MAQIAIGPVKNQETVEGPSLEDLAIFAEDARGRGRSTGECGSVEKAPEKLRRARPGIIFRPEVFVALEKFYRAQPRESAVGSNQLLTVEKCFPA